MSKKHLKNIGIILLLLLLSCEYNVEKGLAPSPCNPEPVTHEIMWKMGVSGQLASLNIKPGDTVRWIWTEDNMPHDVHSDDPNAPADFGSAILIGQGTIYEYTFTEETVFDYNCS
ncbi:MAG: plastocyanin/azurin family copper-binding protein, partial [Flavobacteriaceae bacterium]